MQSPELHKGILYTPPSGKPVTRFELIRRALSAEGTKYDGYIDINWLIKAIKEEKI